MTRKTIFKFLIVCILCSGIFVTARNFFSKGLFAFAEGKPVRFGEYTVVARKIQGTKLEGVRISSAQRVLEAERAEYAFFPLKKLLKLTLINGSVDVQASESFSVKSRLTFKKFFITLNLDEK